MNDQAKCSHNWIRKTILDPKLVDELAEKYKKPEYKGKGACYLWRCSKCKIDKPEADNKNE
jgi:hypothetical protein